MALGFAVFTLSYLQTACTGIVGERVTRTLRFKLFHSIMAQEVAWFDKQSLGELVSRISADVALVQTGVGDKVGTYFCYMGQSLVGIIVAFVYKYELVEREGSFSNALSLFSWKMTLVLLSLSPLMAFAGMLQSAMIGRSTKNAQDNFAKANKVAEESISGFRTILSMVLEEQTIRRFVYHLDAISKANQTAACKSIYYLLWVVHVVFTVICADFTAFSISFIFFVIFGTYALGLWYAGTLVADGR
jgi:ATP-binding cassette subfamily B (MDR/TAP) protein 1